jgi:hypothetical protein
MDSALPGGPLPPGRRAEIARFHAHSARDPDGLYSAPEEVALEALATRWGIPPWWLEAEPPFGPPDSTWIARGFDLMTMRAKAAQKRSR